MRITVDAPIIGGDPLAWSREWTAKYNAMVAGIVADADARRYQEPRGSLDREGEDDNIIRLFFWRFRRPRPDCKAEVARSDDSYLYEHVQYAMAAARADERRRIASALSSGLDKLFGDEAAGLIGDVADVRGLLDD